jgi:cation/acetate symporter
VLLLGIWWRGLTARGAGAGMIVGGIACGGAILFGSGLTALLSETAPFLVPLVQQPAAWTVPLAFLTAIVVSRDRRRDRRVPREVDGFMARIHLPERVAAPRP